MTSDKRTRARVASTIAFFVCLPVGFYVGITLIGHARFIPYWSTWIDRLILAAALFGIPALVAFGTYRFALGGRGVLAAALFWSVGGVLAFGGIAFVVFYISLYIESASYERSVAQTRVSDVRDEPIASGDGRQIGVRVSFAAELPSTRRSDDIRPRLSAAAAMPGAPMGIPGFSLDAKRARIDGGDGFRWPDLRHPDLAPGRHEFVFDLYPDIADMNPHGEPCLSSITPPMVPAAEVPVRFRMAVSGTSYGAIASTAQVEETRNSYSVVEMYRAVMEGAIEPCPERK